MMRESASSSAPADAAEQRQAAAAARPPVNDRREIFGWTMFDWANSAFSTTVATVFLGPYLTSIAEAATRNSGGFLYLGQVPIKFDSFFTFCVSASVLLEVTFLPVLGALADYSHLRKQFLMLFSTLGALATLLMFAIGPGQYLFGGALFIIANLAFGACITFYNSYLPDIASEDRRDHVSAAGFGLGYLGGGLLLVGNLIMYLLSDRLGLTSALVARISLASAGAWWLGFSLITFRTLRPRHAVQHLPAGETYFSIGFRQLGELMGVPVRLVTSLMLLPLAIPILIFAGLPIGIALLPAAGPLAVLVIFIGRKARTEPEAMKFLVAYLLYNDGIQTVIVVSAIFAAEELHMSATMRILVILMIQFVAFGGSYLFSYLARLMGTKRAILLSLFIWSGATIYAFFGMRSAEPVPGLGMTQQQFEFWIMGALVAIVLGGSQALSRSLFAQMIPRDQQAEYFSFYEISDRGTSWLGTFVFGLANQLLGSLRLGILSLIFFFLVGLVLLPFVNVPKAMQQARQATPGVAGGTE
ncbi:MAG TPA: MFS transporter [Anaerolineae bacterium]